jgi:hypothetical protein
MTDVAAAFRAGIEGADMDAVIDLLDDEVVFHSPVVYAPSIGRDAVAPILHAVAMVFQDFRYLAEFASEDGHVLHFAARVGDRTLDGIDMIRIEDGKIVEFTVMVRPYSAAGSLRERMAELLAE